MARLHVVDENLGPLLDILTWLFLVATILVVIMRLSVRKFIIRRMGSEDLLIVASMSIMLAMATGSGLGQMSTIDMAPQQSKAFMAFYVSQILFIGSFFFSKFSLVIYLYGLCPIVGHRRAVVTTGAVTVVWMISSIFLIAFQCPLPTPWLLDAGKCINLVAVFEYVTILSLLTDAALTLQPIIIVSSLQAKTKKKAMLAAVFALRVSVVATTVVQLVYGTKAWRSDDMLWHLWPVVICTQILQFLSILTTSTIYLKPCFKILQSGFYQAGDLKRQHVTAYGFEGTFGSWSSKNSPPVQRLRWSPWNRQRSAHRSSADEATLSPSQEFTEEDVLRRNERHQYRTSIGPGPAPDLLDSFNASQIMRTVTMRVEQSAR